MLKTKFKVGDRIMYHDYKYEISKVTDNFYEVKAIPPYDADGVVLSIGPGGENSITRASKNGQMTVGEFIYELQQYNPEARVCIGDNFYNRVSISYGYSEGCTKKNCEFVCLDVAGKENKEKEYYGK